MLTVSQQSSSSSSRGVGGLVALLTLASAVAYTPVLGKAAGDGFLCTDKDVGGWTGPNASNNIPDCFAEGNFGIDPVVAVPMFFPAFIGALVILLYPLTMLCRYACDGCGSNRRRPGTLCWGGSEWDHAPVVKKEFMYTVEEVRRIKICTLVGFVLSFVGLGLTVVGHNNFTSFYDYFDSYLADTITPYYNVLQTDVEEGLKDDTNTFYPPINAAAMSAFSTQVNSISDDIRDVKNKAGIYRDTIYNGANVMAISVIVIFALAAIYAALDVRSVFPAITSCFSFFVVVILAIFSAALFFGNALLTNGCEEVDLHTARQPGVFQWQLVPECEDNSRFGPLIADIDTVEVRYAKLACDNLFDLCDASTSGSKTYYCPNRVNFATSASCVSYANVQSIMTGMYAKNHATACSDLTTTTTTIAPPTTTSSNNCTIERCKDQCTKASDLANATRLIQYNTILAKVSAAKTRVQELSDCNAQYDRVVKSVDKCAQGKKGMALLGSGSTINAYLTAWAIYIFLRGQKRFFKHGATSKKKYRLRRRKRRTENGSTIEEGSTYVAGSSMYEGSTMVGSTYAGTRQPY